jgi:drug/metabolite transporter (DMT)-like permease
VAGHSARATGQRMRRIGVLTTGTQDRRTWAAFHQSLEKLGLSEGVFLLNVLPPLLRTRIKRTFRSQRPGLQVFRGLALVVSSILFISSPRYLPIAEATATSFAAPLFITALSVVVLGEKVGHRRWAATFAGLLGVLVVVRPGTSAFHPASILPLMAA